MYGFKRFDTTYSVRILKEDSLSASSSFECCMEVSIIRTFAGNYDFIFKKRSKVLINECSVENSADLMMLKLGDAIFPLSLRKSSENWKLSVEDQTQIIERWDAHSQLYLSENSADTLVQYIKTSRKNITDKACLLKSILRVR